MIKTVGLVCKPDTPEALGCLQAIRKSLPQAHFFAEQNGYHAIANLPSFVEPTDGVTLAAHADLMIAIGGDGTLIHAASLLINRVVPILGVNLGHVGFLAEVTGDEVPQALELINRGALPYSDRMRLDVTIERDGEIIFSKRVLNDAVLSSKELSRIFSYRINAGEDLVTTVRGDGVIISTPTGSTAYSMAAGGSIVAPEIEAIAITPICPHQLSQRPLIVPPTVTLSLTTPSAESIFATCDGAYGQPFQSDDTMIVRRAAVGSRVLRTPWRNNYEVLRNKLHWGEA